LRASTGLVAVVVAAILGVVLVTAMAVPAVLVWW
jgi:hypothetical protein